MPVPTLITDLSTTAASNSPAGGDTPADGDNHIRALAAFIASILANSGNGWTSPYLPNAGGTVAGNLSVNGNTTLGDAAADTATVNATTSFPLAVSTHTFGVKVGNVARADGNTLDWYEEGTFTPAMTIGGSTVGITYTTRTGTFTRIGNRVTFSIYILLSSKGGLSGAVTITGMPYAASSAVTRQYVQASDDNTSAVVCSNAYLDASGTTLTLQNTAWSSLNGASLNDTSKMVVAGIYQV